MRRNVVLFCGLCLAAAYAKAMYELGHFTFFDEV